MFIFINIFKCIRFIEFIDKNNFFRKKFGNFIFGKIDFITLVIMKNYRFSHLS